MRLKWIALLFAIVVLAMCFFRSRSYEAYDPYDTYENAYESETYEESSGEFTVYVRVPDGWDDIHLWAGAAGVTGMFPDFPGMRMALGEDGWYSIPVNAMFEYVVISANGGAAMTESIYCAGEDLWVICDEAAYTYSGFEDGSGMISAAVEIPADYYGGMTPYYRLLEQMKQGDIRIVSENLEVMALLSDEEGTPVKMEYGYDSTGLKEISVQTYYDMNGASDEEISEFITELRNFYQIELSGYGCVQIWDELRDAYVVLVVYCTDLEVPEYSRTVAYLFGGGDILTEGDYVRMPTEMEAESMGYCIQYY